MKINRSHSALASLLFFIFFAFPIAADAQKPKQGDWLTEIGISMPFGGQNNQYFYNSNVSNYANNNYYYQQPVQSVGLNTRYYKKVNMVYRTRLSFGGGTSQYALWTFNGVEGIPFKQNNKSANLSFGIEKHFNTSSNKFSPFHMLGVTAGFSTYKGKHLSDTLTVGSNWWYSGWSGEGSYLAKMNTLNLGINYLFGFDYWITSDMYIGLEYGFNLNYGYSGAQEQTLLKINNLKVDSETVRVHQAYNSFSISNFASPYIRFGWRFYKSPRSGG